MTDIQYPLEGNCQCGQVRYHILQPFLYQAVCHCTDCHKMSATSFSISAAIPKDAFKLITGQLKTYTKTAESGHTVNCYFCADCGNRIYHHSTGSPDIYRVKPGTLEDTRIIKPDVHVWTRSKQDWVKIPDDILQYETQPENQNANT
ncbi:MAG: GFA family protein [Pseudomonadales bacterium]|nr:GFA family protein [Pseudomonadales bacterium]